MAELSKTMTPRMFQCPACHQDVEALVQLEHHIPEVTQITLGTRTVEIETTIVGVKVAHDCTTKGK